MANTAKPASSAASLLKASPLLADCAVCNTPPGLGVPPTALIRDRNAAFRTAFCFWGGRTMVVASGEGESSMRQAHRGDRDHRRRRRICCLAFVAVLAAAILGATSPSARARHEA